jgi:hypothetical protein
MISFVIHDKFRQEKKRLSTRSEERENRKHNSSQVRFVPLGKVPADTQNHPSIYCL